MRFYTNTEVTSADLRDDGMHEVVTSRGTFLSQTVVIAAGPWSGRIGELHRLNIPIKPVKQQIIITDAVDTGKSDFLHCGAVGS